MTSQRAGLSACFSSHFLKCEASRRSEGWICLNSGEVTGRIETYWSIMMLLYDIIIIANIGRAIFA